MPIPGEEIRRRLEEFVARWRDYSGTERAEAQSFLNELLACYDVDRKGVAHFEDPTGAGIIDMIWPGVCIVEMKRPSEAGRLDEHRDQALGYWQDVSRRTGKAGSHVVVCAFRRFDVYEPGTHWDEPIARFGLDDLPGQYEALGFLGGLETRYVQDHAELTREAVSLVTQVFQRLEERRGADPGERTDLILQCVWCMFAEDLGMLPGHVFTRILDELIEHPTKSSADDLGQLFRYLAEPEPRPEHGLYAGTPYADGGLFERPAALHLELDELELLRQAASYDWKLVEPAIFGSLLEGALGPDRVWALGAHYTAEADIMKVVGPTVLEPWRERIDSCTSLAEVEQAQRDLAEYVVLDPACGSGNFLYVAYRSLRRLEQELRRLERKLRQEAGLGGESTGQVFPVENMKGIEVEPFAVQLARVTLWMGHKLAVVELGLDEPVLPLHDLSGIRRADALKVAWPRADAIIGNPPYIGTKLMRSRLGDEYLEWLSDQFRIGVKDYCVYWFRKAHDHLEPGDRAGLVGTNSIREGSNRETSLDFVVERGGVITDAVSSQPWSGAANVHVSIVNWVKEPTAEARRFRLDGIDVDGITSALRPGKEAAVGLALPQNAGKQFFGVVPGGAGFVLESEEAEALLARPGADYAAVVRPFLVGADITSDPRQAPSRFVLDFHFNRLEDATAYPAALEIVRRLVKPHRDTVRRKAYRERWWRLEEPIVAMRDALASLSRYIACPAQGKRVFMIWCQREWLPSNLTSIFAFEDDYSMGLLSSSVHTSWAIDQSTKLKSDPRYTKASFATFPWPDPADEQREAIADLARRIIGRRQEICAERQIGLTKLYNELDDGAYRDLRELHRSLDEAVAAAYGWPKKAAHDPAESNRRLLELNRRIAAGEVEYRPFG